MRNQAVPGDLWVGQEVVASEEFVGELVEVLVGDEAEYLHVRRFGFGSDELYIPSVAISSVDGDHIYLNVRWGSLAAQAWHERPPGAVVRSIRGDAAVPPVPRPRTPSASIARTDKPPSPRGAAAIQLEVSAAELELLGEVLDRTYRDLKGEISDTDNAAYKHDLKEREAVVVGLLHKLGQTDTAPLSRLPL